MKIFNKITIIIGSVGGCIASYLGGYDLLLRSLITFIVIDYLSGLLKATYNKQLNSDVGFKGILKKVMILLVVAMSYSLSVVINMDFRNYIIMFFIANEGISILENAGEFLPIPKQLLDMLEKLKSGDFNDKVG